MAEFELVMPKMGESIMEATILKWLKKEGDPVGEDETILEIATDKVDSDIPSPVEGIIREIRFEEDAVVAVGETIALITIMEEEENKSPSPQFSNGSKAPEVPIGEAVQIVKEEEISESFPFERRHHFPPQYKGRFYSPLVRSIAKKEGLTLQHLSAIKGTGLQGRVTKKDLVAYLNGDVTVVPTPAPTTEIPAKPIQSTASTTARSSVAGADEIIQMDRMRRLIAEHMVMSKRTSAHVTSFVEADVTDVVNWRNEQKDAFTKQYGGNLTFTPIFIYAVAKAIRDFPLIYVQIEGDQIILKRAINIGMAAALPNGNLIVPVIEEADNYSVFGLARKVNDLAGRARVGELKPDEIRNGTFTLTNVGTFGNVMGTPIINQPQVAILATGAIKKKPAVVETKYGDLIAVRHMVFLSLSYDHRVVDGQLGGSFLRRIADYLEQFRYDHQG